MSALPGRRLARALARAATDAGAAIEIDDHREEAWASATFVGARHWIAGRAATTDALGHWLDAIDPEALRVPGHVVAELRLQDCTREPVLTRVRLTGLTVSA